MNESHKYGMAVPLSGETLAAAETVMAIIATAGSPDPVAWKLQ